MPETPVIDKRLRIAQANLADARERGDEDEIIWWTHELDRLLRIPVGQTCQ